MIYDLQLAWRNVRARSIHTAITVAVVALAVALVVAVTLLGNGVRRGIVQASDPFGVLVVGAKGSAQQLVLSTILLQDEPVGNMPRAVYERLRTDERVALAVPLAMGDNVEGARIIGTNQDFFTLQPSANAAPTFQLAQGQLFAAEFEAVVGSTAAARLGLTLGDTFAPQHGVARGLPSDNHDTEHRVVGILQPTNSPYDNAVFTSLESVWHVHEEGEEEQALDQAAPPGLANMQAPDVRDQITAVLLKPRGFVEANQIWRDLQLGTDAQAAFPGQELGALFDLLSQAQGVLNMVGYLAAGMAALTVLLALYSATLAREQSIAIMRSLGARRSTVFRIILAEALIVTLVGTLVGRVLGYVAASAIAATLTAQRSIPIPIRMLPALEPWLWLVPLMIGLVAGLFPALMAYRVNVVEKLFPA